MRDDRVLDLFAGPGGWDEGVRSLGLRPVGVEWDTAACQTAMAAGHVRFQHDIAALDPREFAAQVFDGPVRGLIASPPCQGFSQAGKQQGRKDAATLLAAIPEMVRRDVRPELREGMADSRSILVLEPLRWALALTPSWVAWEQVPAVLPIWDACSDVLRSLGYTVATGNLQSEQYGVPQTRKRAILVARAPWMTAAMGRARLPEATHSRYYSRTPAKLDPGVLPWVSMAQALGWGMTARPAREQDAGRWIVGFPRRSDGVGEDVEIDGELYRARDLRDADQPAQALTEKARSWKWLRHNQGYRDRPVDPETGKARVRNEDGSDYYQRFDTDAPAPSLTTQVDAWKWDDATSEDGRRWVVERELRMGTQANATVRAEDQPAPTVLFGKSMNTVEWQQRGQQQRREGAAVRVTIAEAAVLQSFPADYPWQGTKTAQYRQVGDAVPPQLARVVVSEVSGIPLAVADETNPWPFRKPSPTVLGSMQGVLPKPGQTHHKAVREVTALEQEPEDAA